MILGKYQLINFLKLPCHFFSNLVSLYKYAMQISICLEYLDRFLNSDNYIDYPENGFTWEKTERGGNVLKTSKEAKRASLKHYNFEQENFRMFWKRFVQWHRNWWC